MFDGNGCLLVIAQWSERWQLKPGTLLVTVSFSFSLFHFIPLNMQHLSSAGETKRKTLPSWLREELEKMEHQRQKKLEKEAKDAARRERRSRPTWRDELDEEEEKEEGGERHRSSRSYRYSHSKSPNTNKVCLYTQVMS